MIGINVDWKTIAALTGSGIVVYFLVKSEGKQAVAAVKETLDHAGDILDPTAPTNAVYQGTSQVVDILDDGVDNDSNTVGTAVHTLVENIDGDAINPASSENVVYQGVNTMTEWITGDDRPFGVQLYEWFNDDMTAANPPQVL
ncbi:hypothetical protein HBA55_34445 [Pseudomaricurvus alkylphenolicus]|uniref:hypothetical protein n=1 Tax=Pseudomaricurvus alkylphenolicus TaxID=1306991 RepID=UPI001422515C|nr:hypothetical protein [Pseudomaricurvus alkylphenolicus]NIB44731.1 hypothetical protein [Pseudomaricurvus alkylphenolicus]